MTISLRDRMKAVLTKCVYHAPRRVSGGTPLISESDEAFLGGHLQTIMWEFESAVKEAKIVQNSAAIQKQIAAIEKAAYREGYREGFSDGIE